MQTKPNKSIHIRRSERYELVFARVEEIASKRPHRQVTPVLMEILELGLKSYDNGLRLVENEVLNINNAGAKMNVRREVGRSVFTSLAGSLVDMGRKEAAKPNPNKSKIDFYQLARKALYSQHAKFRHLTDADVEDVFTTLSPILKGLRLAADSDHERERIFEDNKHIFDSLIIKMRVTNGI